MRPDLGLSKGWEMSLLSVAQASSLIWALSSDFHRFLPLAGVLRQSLRGRVSNVEFHKFTLSCASFLHCVKLSPGDLRPHVHDVERLVGSNRPGKVYA